MNKYNREIRWISAVDERNRVELISLEARMKEYYATPRSYYSDIDFTHSAWASEPPYLRIKDICSRSKKILEVGCGAANILKDSREFSRRYTGCDFSTDLLESNSRKYPYARFDRICDPSSLPFADNEFDFVFSVFVIEHVVFPHTFLDECSRVLKPGGTLAIRCPDFLSKGRMSSQIAGFSDGNGREKFRRGAILDAIVTGYDRKIRIPLLARKCRDKIFDKYKFYINTNPVCFNNVFKPDYDAVYLTYRPEILSYLGEKIKFHEPDHFLDGRDIYMQGVKND